MYLKPMTSSRFLLSGSFSLAANLRSHDLTVLALPIERVGPHIE